MTSHEGREETSSNANRNPTTRSSDGVNCVARPRDYQKEYMCLPRPPDYQKEHMCLPRPQIDLFQDASARNIL
jgi:hypothetical protein